MVISSRTPEGQPNCCPVCGEPLKAEPFDAAGDVPCQNCGHLVWFTWEEVGDVQVIHLAGQEFHPESLDRLFDSVALQPGTHLVLDFHNIHYLSSAFLGRLITLKTKLTAIGGKIGLQKLQPELREVLRICRLDQVFDIEA